MKKLSSLILLLAAFVLAPVASVAEPIRLAQAPAAKAAKYQVVIQVSDPDSRLWAQAINYSENLQELLGKENVQVEIVALGQGIGLVKLDSPQANRVADALKRGVAINACESTMKRQKLSKDDMLPAISYTPGGLIRIIDLQKQGWNYIKG